MSFADFCRKKYLGKVVKLVHMQSDPDPIKPGTRGVVEHVDDAGHLHVAWEDGRSLNLLINIDTFEVVDEQ